MTTSLPRFVVEAGGIEAPVLPRSPSACDLSQGMFCPSAWVTALSWCLESNLAPPCGPAAVFSTASKPLMDLCIRSYYAGTLGFSASGVRARSAFTVATVMLLRLIRVVLTYPTVSTVVICDKDRRHGLVIDVDEDGDVPVVLVHHFLVGKQRHVGELPAGRYHHCGEGPG